MQAGDTLDAARAAATSADDRTGRDPLADYAILDTPPEDKFDAAAETAARLAGAPFGAISFVDGAREWVKAAHGMERDEVDRQRSFAGALADSGASALVVPDARADERFAGHPWVAHGPRARFYAAVPLRTAGGRVIGTLAALDTEPRDDGESTVEALRALARTIDGMLEGRRESVLSSGITAVIDFEGRVIRVSKAVEALLGYGADEMIGRRFTDFVHPADVEPTLAEVTQRAAGAGGTPGFETRYVARDGRIVRMAWESELVRDEGLFYTVAKDVTELRESEWRYRLLAENATDMIAQWDLEARLVYLSSAVRTLLGYAPDELVGRYGYELIHPDDTAAVISHHEALLRGTDRVRAAFRIRHRDGHWVWSETIARLLHDADGNAVGIQTATRDISETKRAMDAVQRAEERFRKAFEEGPVGMAIIGLRGVFQRVNRALGDLLRCEPDDLIGSSVFDLMPGGYDADLGPSLLAGEHERVTVERSFTRGDGTTVWASISASVMRDGDGEPAAFLVQFMDMGERRRAEAESRRAREAAETANRAKSQFLARMSHELRTPLNAIMGFAQLLQLDEGLAEQQRESAERIVRGGRHLLEVINDVLDISRIEAGEMPIDVAPVDVTMCVQDAVALVEPLAGERGMTLRLEVEDALHALADRARLRQVLLNLVSNAIKYGPEASEVVVRADADGDRVRVAVVDAGPGLSEEEAARVFEPFERLEKHIGVEGTGLGLALSRNLVRAMGGDVGVRPHAPGSEFWVELQVGDAPRAGEREPREMPEMASQRGSLLYIEDSASNTAFVGRMLELRPNVDMMVAADGEAGIRIAGDQRPDAILLDMTLPDMSGEEVLRRLKADAATASTPVIAVSADVDPARERSALDAGAAAYLEKPVELPQLLAAIDKALCD